MKQTRFSFWTFLFGLLLSTNLSHSQDLDVFVSAHPDDWQLFMNPNAYRSLQDSTKTVLFIHTTAGDAGHGTGNNLYYLAREEGSKRAIRFMVNTISRAKGLGKKMKPSNPVINGKRIARFKYGNAVTYFLRIPDGNYYGPGYPIHANTSLQKLLESEIDNITTIDGSATYDLESLKTTLKELIKSERQNDGKIIFNIADTDSLINPADHSDHRYSSHLFQSIAKDLKVNKLRMYTEYATSEQPMNIFDEEFLICAGTWGATASGLSDHEHYSTWDRVHNAWIGRQYFREIELSED